MSDAGIESSNATRARRAGLLLLLPVWLVVGGLLVVAVLRLFAFDRTELGTITDSYALWLFLPAWLILVAAACFRARALTLATVVLVVTHLAIVVPPTQRTREIPAAARTAPKFRVVTSNMRDTNPDPDGLARELLTYDADVLVLEEVTAPNWRAIQRNGLLDAYPNHVEEVRSDAGGIALLSRRPLENPDIAHSFAWPFAIGEVVVDGQRVSVVGVHLAGPGYFNRHQRHQERIERLLRNTGRPRMVLGDFNSTPYNSWLGDLRRMGMHDAHESRGRVFATTWPNGKHLLPPVLIDHVVLDARLVPLDVDEGTGHGSDHRPVVADIAVLPE